MAKSLVALGAAAMLGAATLTTSKPAAAQPWLLPVAAGFLTGAFVGAAAASPYPYYPPYYGYGYNGYGYNGYYNGYNGYGYNGYNPAYYSGYAEPYYAGYGASTTVVIVNGGNGYNGYSCHHNCRPYYPTRY
jgi:hypothetical protein